MLDPSIAMVGDVDVAVELGRRKPSLGPNGLALDWVDWNIARFEMSGRAGGSFLDRICYGEFEVMRLLKSRVTGLSLHTLEDLNSSTRKEMMVPALPRTACRMSGVS
jgi:hypothetical protein